MTSKNNNKHLSEPHRLTETRAPHPGRTKDGRKPGPQSPYGGLDPQTPYGGMDPTLDPQTSVGGGGPGGGPGAGGLSTLFIASSLRTLG